MSTKGIYTAVSGAIAQSQRLETIANNIANVNTPGFKRDSQVFKEYLASYEKPPDVIEAPRDVASIESFYNMQGGDKSYVDNAGTFTDFRQGALKVTGNPLDVAIEGQGFFEISTPQGVRYTRHGAFSLDGEGRLVTKEGFPVLAQGTQAPDARVIRFSAGGPINVSNGGEVSQGGQAVAKLSLVNVDKMDALQKVGSSSYKLRDNFQAVINTNPSVQLHQGSIETSNVNVVQEMTDMISATRTFESLNKAIQTYDQMNEKLVNVIPKF